MCNLSWYRPPVIHLTDSLRLGESTLWANQIVIQCICAGRRRESEQCDHDSSLCCSSCTVQSAGWGYVLYQAVMLLLLHLGLMIWLSGRDVCITRLAEQLGLIHPSVLQHTPKKLLCLPARGCTKHLWSVQALLCMPNETQRLHTPCLHGNVWNTCAFLCVKTLCSLESML